MTDMLMKEKRQETFSRKLSFQRIWILYVGVVCFLLLRSFCLEAKGEGGE